MASAGLDAAGGQLARDFAHVQQSIATILTTPIGSRVMRREFGSELFDLIDRPMTDQVILAVYAAAALAIARWEPRYQVTRLNLTRLTPGGQVGLEIFGTYFPRGHLGDFSQREERSATIGLTRASTVVLT